jgi:glycosyltransferase involved in cell wall biosynthesis
MIQRTLESVEGAIDVITANTDCSREDAEIIVVEDGSTDDTWEVIQKIAGHNPLYKLIHRPKASNASCARNRGVDHSCGALLFFLDGDDLFLPDHIDRCYQTLQDERWQFVKTGARLADPVHPDWKAPIDNSIIINLCVRRECHFFIGGFLDYHLFVRQGDAYHYVVDIFSQIEDMYYNQLLAHFFVGAKVSAETVEYIRYPGNAYDRQYEQFQYPMGAHQASMSEQRAFQFQLANAILQNRLRSLSGAGVS